MVSYAECYASDECLTIVRHRQYFTLDHRSSITDESQIEQRRSNGPKASNQIQSDRDAEQGGRLAQTSLARRLRRRIARRIPYLPVGTERE